MMKFVEPVLAFAVAFGVVFLGGHAFAQESTGSTSPRTEIDGSYRVTTYNGVRVWRPFPPAPAPVIVTPPPPANIYIQQRASAEANAIQFYSNRRHFRR